MAGVYRIHQDHESAYFQKPTPLPSKYTPTVAPRVRRPKRRDKWKKPPPRKVKPKVAAPNPENISPKIGIGAILRMFGKSPVLQAIKPTAMADATYDPGPYFWQESGFEKKPDDMVASQPEVAPYEKFEPPVEADWEYEMPLIPEVPYKEYSPDIGPAITRSPKVGTTIVNLPDVVIPPPLRLPPEPQVDIWQVPDVTYPELWPDVAIPEPSPELEMIPPKSVNPRRPPALTETGVAIEVEKITATDSMVIDPEIGGTIRVRFRPYKARASRKRRKDTKAHRAWIKAAHKVVSLTYGTYSEIVDALEALAWNIYVEDSKGVRHLAAPREGGSLLKTVDGLIDGRYELDMEGFIVDYVTMQAMDALQGKFNKQVVKQSVDQGWWTSPVGPQGFVSKQGHAAELIDRETYVLYEGNT
jgi:hypothetical protein